MRWEEWVDRNLLPLVAVGFSIFGGAVRALQCDRHGERFSWRRFCWGLLASAFVGALCAFLTSSSPLPPRAQVALAGMAGYSAAEVLRCLPDAVRRALRL